MNRSEFNNQEKDIITGLDEAFVQSLEMVLSSLSEETISISPLPSDMNIEDIFTAACMVIDTEYTEGFSGKDRMVFKLNDAIPFTQLAMGEKIDQTVNFLDELHQSVFSEIVSQVISSTITVISGKISKKINFSFPQITVIEDPGILKTELDREKTVELYYSLVVGSIIDSVFLYQVPKDWLNFLSKKQEEPAPVKAPPPPPPPPQSSPPSQSLLDKLETPPFNEQDVYETKNNYAQPQNQTYISQEHSPGGYTGQKSSRFDDGPTVQPARFSQIKQAREVNVPNSIDLFLDVPMKLTAVLGRAVLYLKDVLEMGSGSVFELDRLAGEPIDLLVNNKLVARGEVVVIDEKFGVRVIETLEDIKKKTGTPR